MTTSEPPASRAAWSTLQAHLTLVLDGYSAPLTAGNFVRNVLEGAYTNAQLKVDQGAVLAGRGAAGGELAAAVLSCGGDCEIVGCVCAR